MKTRSIFTLFFISSIIVPAVLAQQPIGPPKTISAGVVNSKATNLPKPEYPAAAQLAKAGGEVKVQVVIDEQGNVTSANVVSGHPLLRPAAENAARLAKFSPTFLSGKAVKVSGVIVYNFVAVQSNEERVRTLEIATFLFLVRNSVNDLEKLNKFFDSKDFVKESVGDFPELAKEFAPLNFLKDAPGEKRTEIVDGVIASVRAKLNGTDIWQFDLGKNFGEFMAQITPIMTDDEIDLTKLDESALRLNLTRIRDLTYSAPPDFPTDVLQKFKEFAAVGEKTQLASPENLQELIMKVIALVETISPSSAK